MKKILVSLFISLNFVFTVLQPVSANEYYYEETIEVIEENTLARATQTKTAKKTTSYKNTSGKTLWSVTVTGTFTYNGSTSICTKSNVSTSIVDTKWKIASSSSSKSGNKASATATAKYYSNGAVIATQIKTVTLTCSPTGVLS